MLGLILFNFYINDLFLFIKQATLYNYVNDNTLASFSKSMPNLVDILEQETGVAVSLQEQNEMTANPEKFHGILLRKNQTHTCGEKINIKGKEIISEEIVKLLGVALDYKVYFDPHILKSLQKSCNTVKCSQKTKVFLWL